MNNITMIQKQNKIDITLGCIKLMSMSMYTFVLVRDKIIRLVLKKVHDIFCFIFCDHDL